MPLFSSCSSARIPKVHSPETVLAPLQPFLSGLNAEHLSCCSVVFFNITRPVRRILPALETFGDEEDDTECLRSGPQYPVCGSGKGSVLLASFAGLAK